MGCRALPTFVAALLLGQSLLGSRRNSRYVTEANFRTLSVSLSLCLSLSLSLCPLSPTLRRLARLIHPIEAILHLTRRALSDEKAWRGIVGTNFHASTVFFLSHFFSFFFHRFDISQKILERIFRPRTSRTFIVFPRYFQTERIPCLVFALSFLRFRGSRARCPPRERAEFFISPVNGKKGFAEYQRNSHGNSRNESR